MLKTVPLNFVVNKVLVCTVFTTKFNETDIMHGVSSDNLWRQMLGLIGIILDSYR